MRSGYYLLVAFLHISSHYKTVQISMHTELLVKNFFPAKAVTRNIQKPPHRKPFTVLHISGQDILSGRTPLNREDIFSVFFEETLVK